MDHAGTKFNSHLQHQSTTTEIASVIFMVYASLQLCSQKLDDISTSQLELQFQSAVCSKLNYITMVNQS